LLEVVSNFDGLVHVAGLVELEVDHWVVGPESLGTGFDVSTDAAFGNHALIVRLDCEVQVSVFGGNCNVVVVLVVIHTLAVVPVVGVALGRSLVTHVEVTEALLGGLDDGNHEVAVIMVSCWVHAIGNLGDCAGSPS
jgi:hypothetical protein